MIVEEKWIDELTGFYRGFEYLCVARVDKGFRCGYVKIPEGHPYYENREFTKFNVGYEINWGLTFSGRLKNHNGWWIGFDCNHINNSFDPQIIRDNYPEETARQIIHALNEEDSGSGFQPSVSGIERSCQSIIDELLEEGRVLL